MALDASRLFISRGVEEVASSCVLTGMSCARVLGSVLLVSGCRLTDVIEAVQIDRWSWPSDAPARTRRVLPVVGLIEGLCERDKQIRA